MNSVKLLGTFEDKDVYCIKNKKGISLFYNKKYFIIPSWIKEPENISLLTSCRIINNRLQWELNNPKNPESIKNELNKNPEPIKA